MKEDCSTEEQESVLNVDELPKAIRVPEIENNRSKIWEE